MTRHEKISMAPERARDLVREGIIDDDQAMAIRNRYPRRSKRDLGRIALPSPRGPDRPRGDPALRLQLGEDAQVLKLAVVFTGSSRPRRRVRDGRTAAKETLHVLAPCSSERASGWLPRSTTSRNIIERFHRLGAGALALAWALPSLPRVSSPRSSSRSGRVRGLRL